MLHNLLLWLFFTRTTDGVSKRVIVAYNQQPIQLKKCEWFFHGDYKSESILAKQSTTGFYFCNKTEELIFLLVFKELLTFKYDSTPKKHRLVGNSIAFQCSAVLLIGYKIKLSSNFTITDSSDTALTTIYKLGESMDHYEYLTEVNYLANDYGEVTFYCSLYIELETDHMNVDTIIFYNLTIPIYAPPHDVRPDMLKVEVNESLACSSGGYPIPEYEWTCLGDRWSSDMEYLTIHFIGGLNCTCNASSIIDGIMSYEIWSGTIHAIEKAGGSRLKFLNDIVIIAVVFVQFGK